MLFPRGQHEPTRDQRSNERSAYEPLDKIFIVSALMLPRSVRPSVRSGGRSVGRLPEASLRGGDCATISSAMILREHGIMGRFHRRPRPFNVHHCVELRHNTVLTEPAASSTQADGAC